MTFLQNANAAVSALDVHTVRRLRIEFTSDQKGRDRLFLEGLTIEQLG